MSEQNNMQIRQIANSTEITISRPIDVEFIERTNGWIAQISAPQISAMGGTKEMAFALLHQKFQIFLAEHAEVGELNDIMAKLGWTVEYENETKKTLLIPPTFKVEVKKADMNAKEPISDNYSDIEIENVEDLQKFFIERGYLNSNNAVLKNYA